MFEVYVLGSSSKGNCYYVDTGDCKILLDIGFTFKKTKELLSDIDVTLDDIDYIFITHTHSDHIKGLRLAVKHFGIDVIASEGSFSELEVPTDKQIVAKNGDIIELENITFEARDVIHNTLEPLCYSIENSKGEKLLYLTDLGSTNGLEFENHEVYLIEANYDLEILEANFTSGSLHEVRYERARSGNGHLNIDETIEFLERNIGNNTKEVILCHLSSENSDEEDFLFRSRMALDCENIEIAKPKLRRII